MFSSFCYVFLILLAWLWNWTDVQVASKESDVQQQELQRDSNNIVDDPTSGTYIQCMHSLPRDNYAKRGICRRRVSVCVSVCLSVTLRYCIKTAKRRITQTTPHDSPMTLVFWSERSWRNSNGITPYGGDKCRWGGIKFVTFDEKRAITRKRYKIDV